MGNDYFEDLFRQMYKKNDDSYNQYSSRNQVIEDLIKSISEQAEKYCDEIDQRRNGKHKPKFTDEEFNKTCEELGLVEDE